MCSIKEVSEEYLYTFFAKYLDEVYRVDVSLGDSKRSSNIDTKTSYNKQSIHY